MNKIVTILICFLLNSQLSTAKVTLPNFFANGMVLQQQSQVNFWGKSTNPSKALTVTTSWDKKKYEVNADAEGKWKTKLATPKAGGPYNITINDGDNFQLNEVWIGEVWLVSGQSNMEMPVQGFKDQPVLNS